MRLRCRFSVDNLQVDESRLFGREEIDLLDLCIRQREGLTGDEQEGSVDELDFERN